MNFAKSITSPDSKKILNIVENTNRTIMLAGNVGSGKTEMIKQMLKLNATDNSLLIVDSTMKNGDHMLFSKESENEFYIVMYALKKILLTVQKYYGSDCFQKFELFNTYIDDSIKELKTNYCLGMYGQSSSKIFLDEFVHNFLMSLSNTILYDKLVLVVDDFDKTGDSSISYQKAIYNKLSEYFQIMLTVSDQTVLDDNKMLKEYSKENKVIKLEYNMDKTVVHEIIKNDLLHRKNNGNSTYYLDVLKFFDSGVINEMIIKTNGNLHSILLAVTHLVNKVQVLSPKEYSRYLFDYIDHVINQPAIFKSSGESKRTLHIKPKNI